MFDQKAILLAALLQIQQEILVPGEGICFNVEIATFNVEGADDLAMNQRMEDIWNEWPEYSGNPRYPVPYRDADPKTVFHNTTFIWDGEYGNSRRRLLAFLIAKLQEKSE